MKNSALTHGIFRPFTGGARIVMLVKWLFLIAAVFILVELTVWARGQSLPSWAGFLTKLFWQGSLIVAISFSCVYFIRHKPKILELMDEDFYRATFLLSCAVRIELARIIASKGKDLNDPSSFQKEVFYLIAEGVAVSISPSSEAEEKFTYTLYCFASRTRFAWLVGDGYIFLMEEAKPWKYQFSVNKIDISNPVWSQVIVLDAEQLSDLGNDLDNFTTGN